jgi:hypothetical protein
MTEPEAENPGRREPIPEEDPVGALVTGVLVSIMFWVGWRVSPIFDHRMALMIWVMFVSLAAGGVAYCIRRAQPFRRANGAATQERNLSAALRGLWTTSYYAEGHGWIKGAWTCGAIGAVLWMAVGLL